MKHGIGKKSSVMMAHKVTKGDEEICALYQHAWCFGSPN